MRIHDFVCGEVEGMGMGMGMRLKTTKLCILGILNMAPYHHHDLLPLIINDDIIINHRLSSLSPIRDLGQIIGDVVDKVLFRDLVI